MTQEVGPLTGFTVGITAAHRRVELGAALERRGARIVYAPAVRFAPGVDDAELLDATKQCLAAPLDVVVVTTATGFHDWLHAAGRWGVGERLSAQIVAADVIARGPKAAAGVRAGGIEPGWTAHDSVSEVLDRLLRRDLAGLRIAVQLHGEPPPDLVDALAAAGAEVLPVLVHRWLPPVDVDALRELVLAAAQGSLECVAFTTASAAASVVATAHEQGCYEQLKAALAGPVVAACVGPMTAMYLQRLDIPTVTPGRSRIGALVREIVERVPQRAAAPLVVATHRLEIRGHLVVIDGTPVSPGQRGLALLRVLARHPGRICGRAELRSGLADVTDEELDDAVSQLRIVLGDSRAVQTIAAHGFRLAHDPEVTGACAIRHPNT